MERIEDPTEEAVGRGQRGDECSYEDKESKSGDGEIDGHRERV